MPIKPTKGETEQEFISRCIAEEVRNGHPQDVSAAICYGYWRKKGMSSQGRVQSRLNQMETVKKLREKE